ncbi:MAG: zinc/manganese transport system permease protein [Streptomyces sp.]|nr:zinc/manganese transport system permease protein [Streptomyces sp.]
MLMADASAGFSWNPVTDLDRMWAYPFMVNAFRAGAIVAVLAGCVGWFMVLRRQSFAGHTLSVVGFPGAAGATLIGVSASAGYFGFCLAAAVVLAAVPRAGGPGDGSTGGSSGSGLRGGAGGAEAAVTGTIQAFLLGCGYLFVALYKGFLNGVNSLLFGSFLGITTDQVLVLLAVAAAALAVLALIGRPLLFASADPEVAAARGVPVRALNTLFLVLLGAAAAEVGQITGSLLVFALLVMPAATAQSLTARPAAGLALSVVIALLVTWTGLITAYYSPYPIGFYVSTFAFGAYVLARAGSLAVSYGRRRGGRTYPGAVRAGAAG